MRFCQRESGAQKRTNLACCRILREGKPGKRTLCEKNMARASKPGALLAPIRYSSTFALCLFRDKFRSHKRKTRKRVVIGGIQKFILLHSKKCHRSCCTYCSFTVLLIAQWYFLAAPFKRRIHPVLPFHYSSNSSSSVVIIVQSIAM